MATTSPDLQRSVADPDKEMLEKLKVIMKGRDLYTPKELVRIGIFGCRSSVRRAIKLRHIEGMMLVGRRLVVFKDSIFRYIEERKGNGI